MKTVISYAIVAMFLVGFASSFSTVAKFETAETSKRVTNFEYFRVHRQAFGASLTWSASDAVSFKIERSYDGEFFDVISTINAAGAAATHKFIDNETYPGTIYYRIGAVKADGSVEYSTVQSVLIAVKRG